MLVIRLDTRGDFDLNWPGKDAEVIALGQAFTTYEATLPEAAGAVSGTGGGAKRAGDQRGHSDGGQ